MIHPAGRFDEKWSAPHLLKLTKFRISPTNFTRTIGASKIDGFRGDKIECGQVAIVRDGAVYVELPNDDLRALNGKERHYNVCRPFDEAHMMGCGNWKISRNLAPDPKLAAYCLAEKIGVPTREVADVVTRVPPHSHTICICAKHVVTRHPIDEDGHTTFRRRKRPYTVVLAKDEAEAERK